MWRKYHVLSSAAQGISAGLAHKYAGNYWIAKVLSPTVHMLANASGKIVAKASVADLKPYNRSSSQENAETRSAVADNAGALQRRRVDNELRESAESASPPADQLSATLARASTADLASAPSAGASDSGDTAFGTLGPKASDSISQSSSRRCSGSYNERKTAQKDGEGAQAARNSTT